MTVAFSVLAVFSVLLAIFIVLQNSDINDLKNEVSNIQGKTLWFDVDHRELKEQKEIMSKLLDTLGYETTWVTPGVMLHAKQNHEHD